MGITRVLDGTDVRLVLTPAVDKHSYMDHIGEIIAERGERARRNNLIPTVSTSLAGGALLEMVHEPIKALTAFALWKDGAWSLTPDYHDQP